MSKPWWMAASRCWPPAQRRCLRAASEHVRVGSIRPVRRRIVSSSPMRRAGRLEPLREIRQALRPELHPSQHLHGFGTRHSGTKKSNRGPHRILRPDRSQPGTNYSAFACCMERSSPSKKPTRVAATEESPSSSCSTTTTTTGRPKRFTEKTAPPIQQSGAPRPTKP